MDLTSKIAVVTGGTKGIGFSIAESLVKAGASVFVCSRTYSDVEQAVARLSAFGQAAGKLCDVRVESEVEAVFHSCEKRFGGVDILINNAGMGVFGKTVEEITPEEFRETLETNLFGVFHACHHAIPLIRQRGGGYIINISSLAGQNAHPKMAAYNASKFGLNGFSEALMQEVRHDGIKVSYICPGSVNTYFGGDEPTDAKAWQLQPEDIAQVVIDLLAMDPRALPSKVEIRPSRPPQA
ncbi:MAG TPA: SDR family oxidoreductase [Pyrinomonadaceae bacterium]|nr:SDR family oxidoreductase [Pyrinomonadaceae bacterium]